jgi:hypothetical protein
MNVFDFFKLLILFIKHISILKTEIFKINNQQWFIYPTDSTIQSWEK